MIDTISSTLFTRVLLGMFLGASVILILHWWTKRAELNRLLVNRLYVYPIKSCRGVAVPSIEFDDFGVVNDRRFVVVDERDNFISMRQRRRMMLININISPDGKNIHVTSLCPKAQNLGMLTLPLAPPAPDRPYDDRKHQEDAQEILKDAPALAKQLGDEGKMEDIDVWEVKGKGAEVSKEASAWFTSFFNADLTDAGPSSFGDTLLQPQRYRLLRMYVPRYVADAAMRAHMAHELDKSTCVDQSQVLVTSIASLTEVNKQLKAQGIPPCQIEQFRPNVVVDGHLPWDEDDWGVLTGPNALLRKMSICTRCAVTTIAMDGSVSPKMQPLAWLKKHRIPSRWLPKDLAPYYRDASPMFGTYFTRARKGRGTQTQSIKVSDVLQVTKRTIYSVKEEDL